MPERPLRIGSVPYLNAWPLIWPLMANARPEATLVTADPPRLRRLLQAGRVDVALLSSVEYLADPARLAFAPGYGIVSDGRASSVKLLLSAPPDRVRTLALDPHSLTANCLARIVLQQRYGARFRLVRYDATPASWRRSGADAAVVIGDRALAFGDARHLDLGHEWRRWKRLPFVFALWIHRRRNPRRRVLYPLLSAIAERGPRSRPALAREAARRLKLDPAACLRYVRLNIRYRLGPREAAGLREFAKCLRRLKP
jgi:chorismate dehydratase